MKKYKLLSILLVTLMLLSISGGCASNQSKREINIAIQYGLAYAPLALIKEQHLLEDKLDDVTINWIQVDGPTGIREGMLAGQIDIGFMGPAPAMIGIDNGMDWKIFTGLSFNEVAIVTNQDDIHSLRDFTSDDTIAILSPACTQHVLLAMASEKEFGDPNYFENQLVSMSHPDATAALIAGEEIVAHIATPPYIGTELDNGMHVVMTGEDIMGESFTFITGVVMSDFYSEEPQLFSAFVEALHEAIDYINTDTPNAVKTLAPTYGISQEDMMEQIRFGDTTIYSTELVGIEEFGLAMYRIGFTKNNPNLSEIIINTGE